MGFQEEYQAEIDAKLKANGFDVSKLTQQQKDIIVEPMEAPENYYQDGELDPKQAYANWVHQLQQYNLDGPDKLKAIKMLNSGKYEAGGKFARGGKLDAEYLDFAKKVGRVYFYPYGGSWQIIPVGEPKTGLTVKEMNENSSRFYSITQSVLNYGQQKWQKMTPADRSEFLKKNIPDYKSEWNDGKGNMKPSEVPNMAWRYLSNSTNYEYAVALHNALLDSVGIVDTTPAPVPAVEDLSGKIGIDLPWKERRAKMLEYLKETYPGYTDAELSKDPDFGEGIEGDENYNNAFFEMVDDLRRQYLSAEEADSANGIVEHYMAYETKANGGKLRNIHRDRMFVSKQEWEQKYKRKTPGKIYHFAGGGEAGKADSTAVDFIKALEKANISPKGAHKNQQFIDTVKSIISMSEKEFSDYIKQNPNEKVRVIYNEYNDWIQTYDRGGAFEYAKGGALGMKIQGENWSARQLSYLRGDIERFFAGQKLENIDKEKALNFLHGIFGSRRQSVYDKLLTIYDHYPHSPNDTFKDVFGEQGEVLKKSKGGTAMEKTYVAEVMYRDAGNYKKFAVLTVPQSYIAAKGLPVVGEDITMEELGFTPDEFYEIAEIDFDDEYDHNLLEVLDVKELTPELEKSMEGNEIIHTGSHVHAFASGGSFDAEEYKGLRYSKTDKGLFEPGDNVTVLWQGDILPAIVIDHIASSTNKNEYRHDYILKLNGVRELQRFGQNWIKEAPQRAGLELATGGSVSDASVKEFLNRWGYTHKEAKELEGFKGGISAESECLINVGYVWLDKYKVWVNKDKSYSNHDEKVLDYLRGKLATGGEVETERIITVPNATSLVAYWDANGDAYADGKIGVSFKDFNKVEVSIYEGCDRTLDEAVETVESIISSAKLATGGTVGSQAGYTIKGRKGNYYIDDVENKLPRRSYVTMEEVQAALTAAVARKKARVYVPGPAVENLIEANRFYAKGGAIDYTAAEQTGKDPRLAKIKETDLDTLEQFHYQHFRHNGHGYALQVIINSVEGDFSQLSKKLRKVAEEQAKDIQGNEHLLIKNLQADLREKHQVVAINDLTDISGDTKHVSPKGTVFIVVENDGGSMVLEEKETGQLIGAYAHEVAELLSFKDKRYPVRTIVIKGGSMPHPTEVRIATEALESALKKSKWKGEAGKIDESIYFYVPDKLIFADAAELAANLDEKYEIANPEEYKTGGTMKAASVKKRNEIAKHLQKATNFDVRISKKLAEAVMNTQPKSLKSCSIMCKEMGTGSNWVSVKKSDLVNKKFPAAYNTFEVWINDNLTQQEVETELKKLI